MSKNNFKVNDLKRMFANPFYCMTIDPIFCQDHDKMVSTEEWIQIALQTVREDDEGNSTGLTEQAEDRLKEFLENLIKNLEGDFVHE